MIRKSALLATSLALLVVLGRPAWCGAAPAALTDGRTGWPRVTGGVGGNPLVSGSADLTRAGVVRDRFRQMARFIVSGDLNGDGRDELALLFADGTLEVQGLEDGRFRRLASWSGISPEAPPVVATGALAGDAGAGLLCVDDRGRLALYTVADGPGTNLASGLSALTAPVTADLDRDGKSEIVAVGDRGGLMVIDAAGTTFECRDTTLLPDSRISLGDMNGDGVTEIVVLTRPLEKVKGARLGDDTEAQGLAVFSWRGGDPKLEDEFKLDGRKYFATLVPLVADIDRSGKLSVAVPVTDEEGGSAVWTFAYSVRSLRKVAEGPKTKDKMYCQLVAAASLGDLDRPALLAVTGSEGQWTLEALRPDLASTRLGNAEGIVTQLPGSRIAQLALVGEFSGTGKRDLLAPGKDGASIRLFAFTGNMLQSREIFTGGKPVSSNLCPGDVNGDGKLEVAFGTSDGSLIVLTGR
jgi:hypothetical protein